jgi:hypothetical protein
VKKEQFISALTELVPGCTKEIAQVWIQFSEGIVEAGHYVDFADGNPNGSEAAAEDWLETLYAGMGLAKQRFNEDVALKIAELGKIPFCLYPYEMYAAAKHLADGGNPEDMEKLNDADLLVDINGDNWPTFPKIEMLSEDTPGEEFGGIAMM